jgi:hypothetical protein
MAPTPTPRTTRRRRPARTALAAAALLGPVAAAHAQTTAPVPVPLPAFHRGTAVTVAWQPAQFDPQAADPRYLVQAIRTTDFATAAFEILPVTQTRTTLALQDGQAYLIVVSAADDIGPPVGVITTAGEITTRIDATPPTVGISLNGGAAYTRAREVVVDVQASDASPTGGPAGGLAGGHLTLIEGDSPICPPGAACTFPFSARRDLQLAEGPDGPRRVRARVNDAARPSTGVFAFGNPSAEAEATIFLDRVAPTARLVADAVRAAPGAVVALDASPSADDGNGPDDSGIDPAAVRWDFGDGTTGTGPAPAHAYTAPGVFRGSVTVADRAGNPSAAVPFTVTVTPAAASAPSAPARPERVRLGRIATRTAYRAGRMGIARVPLAAPGPVRLDQAIARRSRSGGVGRVLARARRLARPGTVTLRFRAPARAGRYVLRVRAGSAVARRTIVVRPASAPPR